MTGFILNQIIFYASLILVLFLPGYVLLLAIFGKSKVLNVLERFIVSFGLSIVSVDFIFFAFSKANISITRLSSFIGISLFVIVCFAVYHLRSKKIAFKSDGNTEKLFSFSKNQFILILLLIFMTIFIKTAYLTETVFPTSTDMGHHMYWTQWLIENHELPTYDGMPDFIIGEHIIFGIIGLLSGASVFSAFPIVVLLLVNLFSILTVFVLTLRIFQNKNVAILVLLLLGVLYAVSSPQAKFVSGGVIGNIMGNLLMPMAFYFYYLAFSNIGAQKIDAVSKKSSRIFLAIAFFLTFGLFYTHHLTGFIFLFIWALLIAMFLLLNFKNLKNVFSNLMAIVFSPQVLGTFFVGLIFFFFVFTPTYIEGSAVETAVGAPSKETRAGLTMDNLKSSIGEARLALGLLGIILMAFILKKKNFGHLLIFSWALMIFIMSFAPQILFINLPSNRIGNYLSYPFAILSAYVLYFVFRRKEEEERSIGSNSFLKIAFIIILAFVLIDGMRDSASSFKGSSELSPLAQTFNASSYLKTNTTTEDLVLKDHNYITADAWIKIFLMRDYKYPLSRGFFKRYEDATKPREMCTLHMISNPNGAEAQVCFSETGTNFIAVNPVYDSAQFKKLENFDQIYSNPGVNIYYKK